MADAYFSSRLVVKETVMPLSLEAVISNVENNRSRIMFWDKDSPLEKVLRDSNDELARFGPVMKINPPIYSHYYNFTGRIVGRYELYKEAMEVKCV